MQVMRIASRIHDYSVHFEEGLDFIARLDGFFVVDANVLRLHGDSALRALDRDRLLPFTAEENAKGLANVQEIWDRLLARGVRRNGTLVSIGGGIVQDVTGFAAATLYRGIRWAYVPTTLLAQADSCIGAKTSLNYGGYKNLIGTFYPPHEVHICPAFLSTLSEADFSSGLGEVIKLHLMGGPELTARLTAEMERVRRREPRAVLEAIRRSLEVKIGYFEGDEFDSGRRNLLNFGHCFGHALEASSDFAIPHGQAVLIGILFANRIAVKRGLLAEQTARALEEDLLLASLVVRPTARQLDTVRILDAFRRDKKRTGPGLPLVMMAERHSMLQVDDLDAEQLAAATGELAARLGA